MTGRRAIWFDAASPPQVLWFSGFARELEDKGLRLFITARSHAGTADLARRFLPRLDVIVEGHDSGGGIGKLVAIARRAQSLARLIKHGQIQSSLMAISHNSYAQIIAAWFQGIPVLTSMDFEGQAANHLAFRLASQVLLPEAFPEEIARRQGASSDKVERYPGVKEEVYLAGRTFPPSNGVQEGGRTPLAVVRPEADYATYQKGSNPIFPLAVDYLLDSGARVMLLPRGTHQQEYWSRRWSNRVQVAEVSVDGPELLRRADLFIGAGGTMTREAAVLGTPAYSVYRGSNPAVDLYLERQGKLRILREPADIETIEVRTNRGTRDTQVRGETKAAVVASIERFVKAYS